MATLAEQLATLQAARASGVLTAEHDGSRITYRSDRELSAAIAYVEAQIAAAANPAVSYGPAFAVFSRG